MKVGDTGKVAQKASNGVTVDWDNPDILPYTAFYNKYIVGHQPLEVGTNIVVVMDFPRGESKKALMIKAAG